MKIRDSFCGPLDRLKSWLLLIAATAVLLPSTGCNLVRQFDESAALTYRDFVWSQRAYYLRYGDCDRPYAEHYESGFRAGYDNVAGGGDGYVPALPPEEYRGYEFQSSDGAKCVAAWFEGYPAGVKAAREDKTGAYNDVMISRLINDAIKQDERTAKLPDDVKIVGRSDVENAGLAESKAPKSTAPTSTTLPTSVLEGRGGIPRTFPSSWLRNARVPGAGFGLGAGR